MIFVDVAILGYKLWLSEVSRDAYVECAGWKGLVENELAILKCVLSPVWRTRRDEKLAYQV